MEESKGSELYKAYITGYQDGVADAYNGTVLKHSANHLMHMPIAAMELTTRARNCLLRAGCKSVADVIALDEHSVQTMRNLGSQTAAEVARWLMEHGCISETWCHFL